MLRTPLLHLGVAALAMAEAVSKEQKKKGPKLSEEPRIRRQLDAFGAGRMEILARTLEPLNRAAAEVGSPLHGQ